MSTRWTRFRGDTHPVEFAVKSSDGTAVDLTGWTALTLTVSTEQNPADTAAQVAQIAGSVTDAPGGLVSFAGTDLGTLSAGTLWYDVQGLDASSNKRTVAKGPLSIEQDITKS